MARYEDWHLVMEYLPGFTHSSSSWDYIIAYTPEVADYGYSQTFNGGLSRCDAVRIEVPLQGGGKSYMPSYYAPLYAQTYLDPESYDRVVVPLADAGRVTSQPSDWDESHTFGSQEGDIAPDTLYGWDGWRHAMPAGLLEVEMTRQSLRWRNPQTQGWVDAFSTLDPTVRNFIEGTPYWSQLLFWSNIFRYGGEHGFLSGPIKFYIKGDVAEFAPALDFWVDRHGVAPFVAGDGAGVRFPYGTIG